MDSLDILYKTYDLKIHARQYHQDNFHKWTTFYCVAIGAIFFSHYQSGAQSDYDSTLIFVGLVISYLWHLSCKGYKHWNDHWIIEIWKLEQQIPALLEQSGKLPKDTTIEQFLVYTAQPPKKKVGLHPIHTALISTPKTALAFSFIIYLTMLFLVSSRLVVLSGWQLWILVIVSMVSIHLLLFCFVSRLLYSGTKKETIDSQ